uniref:Mitochondrial import inner membrane translocase subunit n=1 Tax=Parastrongyloides trichosuri TaxID=131310 RepID=A0A0N5A1J9_PARTI
MAVDPSLSGFLQELQAETQKAKFAEQVHTLTGRCWDVCFPDNRYPGRMDPRNERCLSNCVNRFIDASAFMVNHLQGHSSSGGGHHHETTEAKKSSWW